MKKPTKKIAEVVALRTPHTFSVKHWAANETLQVQLQSVLDMDILKLAFQTLLVTAMPSAQPSGQVVPGVSAEAIMLENNNRYHNRSGFTQFYRALHNLARAKDAPQKEMPWGELLPEDE